MTRTNAVPVDSSNIEQLHAWDGHEGEYWAANAEYFALLKKWSAHMFSAIDAGRIPLSFRSTLDHWRDRNIDRFGEPKRSGDDCLETVVTQLDQLREAGFAQIETCWAKELWAVVLARKAAV